MRLSVPKLGKSQANWVKLVTLEGRKSGIHFGLGQRPQRKWTGKNNNPEKDYKPEENILFNKEGYPNGRKCTFSRGFYSQKKKKRNSLQHPSAMFPRDSQRLISPRIK